MLRSVRALSRPLTMALALALLTAASAQPARPLEAAAPAETILAVGLTPGELPDGDLHEALADLDWEGAAEAWRALAPALAQLDPDLAELGSWLDRSLDEADASSDHGVDALLSELGATCPGLADDVAALEGVAWADDALATLSMDAFAPLPAGLLLVRTDAAHEDAVDAAFERAVGCLAAGDAGQQDGTTLHLLGDGGDLPLVAARTDDLIVVGTRPDVVRRALRLENGADEASFADTPIGGDAAAMEPGVRVALRTAVLADVLEARVPTFGDPSLDVVLERATAALRTFGGAALRLGADDAGVRAESVVAFDPEGGDAALAALLACEGCRASGPFLVPADAMRASGSVWRPEAWFDYADGWVRDLSAAAGEPTDLRTLLREEAGIDVDLSLLDWVGREVQVVRLEPLSTDLRALVYQPATGLVLPVASRDAAEEGMRALGDAFAALYEVAAADDPDLPDELSDVVAVRDAEVGGVPYRRIRIGPNYDTAVGLIGNRLVIASPATAFADFVAVERGDVRGGFSSEGWRRLNEVADGADLSAWSYGEGGGDLQGLADLVDLAAQPLAFLASLGLEAALDEARGGGDDVPFDDGASFGDAMGTAEPLVDVATASRGERVDTDAADAATLAVPGEARGTLGDGDAALLGKGMDVYRLEGLRAGETYTVEMTSGPVDTYLYLVDAGAGAVLARNDDAPFTDRSAIAFVADGETELLVGASSWSGSSSGAYTLRVEEGEIASPDPFGSSVDPMPVDVSSTAGYGSAEVTGAPPTPVRVPVALDRELGAGEDATYLNDELVDLFELDGLRAGEEVTVVMTSQRMDTYLTLVDLDGGRILHENDDSPGVDRSELRLVADGETRLGIAAGSFSGADEGPYALTIEATGAADDEPAGASAGGADGEPASASADAAGDDAEDRDGAAPGADGGDAEAEAVEPPTFDQLLTLFDVVSGVLDEVGERLGVSVGYTLHEDGRIRSVQDQAFDW